MRFLALLSLMALVASHGWSQTTDTFGYSQTSQTTNDFFVSESPTSLGASSFTGGLAGDDVRVSISLPFEFKYYGDTIAVGSAIVVSSNGFIIMNGSTDGATRFTTEDIPAANAPNAAIYGFWYDIEFDAESTFDHGTVTINGNPGYVMTWNSFGYYSETGDTIKFQIVLESINYNIYVINNLFSSLSAGTSSQAIVGIENDDGTDGIQAAKFNNGESSAVNTAYMFDYPGTTAPNLSDGDGTDVTDTSSGGDDSGVFTGASPPGLENNEVVDSSGGGCLISKLRKAKK